MRKAVLVAALVLAACSNVSVNPLNWFGSRDAGPKIAELPVLPSSIAVRVIWQANLGSAGGALFSPAAAAGSVYAAGRDGTVARFESGSGRQLWRVGVGQTLTGGVGADASLAVVGTGQGEVIALDTSNGQVRWRARASSEVLAPPVVIGDLVVVRSADSKVFAFDARDGKRRWVYQRSLPTLSVRTPAGVVARGGMLYGGFSGGKLVALSLVNGGMRWEGTVALPKGTTELERVTDVVGLPWLAEREVCAVAYQGRVACFDAASGNSLWSREMSSFAGLCADSRFVFVTDDKGSVHALDRSGGTSVWTQDRLSRRGLTAPLALGREVVVGDIQGYVHFLSRENGSFVGRVATDGSPVLSNPVPLDAGFLVQTRNGGLYAISTQ